MGEFNVRLKRLREEKGVQQKDVAKYINVSERVYGYYEDERFPKDPDTLTKLAEYFGCTVDFLIGSNRLKGIELPLELRDIVDEIEIIKNAKKSGLSKDDIKDILDAAKKIKRSRDKI